MLKDKHLIFVILAVAFFFLVNALWVKLDNQLPIIGDDARWLEETYRMTDVVKTGDIAKIWEKWQTMFIENTNSFPRTPLFTLMSVPVFILTGPNENAAITLNAFVLAISSILLYFLILNLFNGIRYKKTIAVFSVLLFNFFPGYFGFARLYMSEVLQTFFIILICLYISTYKENTTKKVWFGLGVLLALAMLLRFIMPIYLFLPGCYFLYYQFKQKKGFKKYLLMFLAFIIGFLPLFLSWYGRNFQAYWDFTKYTSSGDLAEISSLGPVFSLTTIAKFWKVIATWHFGWPIIATMVFISIWIIGKFRTSLISKFKGKNKTKRTLLILFLLPLPALIISTLSVNKTARYILPIEFFWLVLFSFFVTLIWKTSMRFGKLVIIGLVLILFYQFAQGDSTHLPQIPYLGQIYTTAQYIKSDPKEEKYSFLLDYFSQKTKLDTSVKEYLIPEQTQLNDAELIWYFREKGYILNSIGEFSTYTSLEAGESKIKQADYVVVDTKPILTDKYNDKYKELVAKVRASDFIKVDSNANLNLEIYVRVF